MNHVEETGHVIYQSKMTHGKNRKNFEVYKADAFIAAITQHIPQKSFQMVRYDGWYSNIRIFYRSYPLLRSVIGMPYKGFRLFNVMDYSSGRDNFGSAFFLNLI